MVLLLRRERASLRGVSTFRETSQGVRNVELDSQRVKCMCCAVHSASQRNSEMDEIPLEITGSILVENRAKDLPRAAREDQRGHPTCRKPTRTVFCVPEVIKLRQKPALESVF